MRVRSIAIKDYMSHDKTMVDLPETGIVVVTGPNGSGKSTMFPEAIATACWNKSLRGTPPWRKSKAGMALVETDKIIASRTRTAGGKLKLKWEPIDDPERDKKWESNTDAQNALNSVIGSFDKWRRTHVFSSADAANFTLATDSERKKLIEAILGTDRFDKGLKACRDDIKVEVQALADMERSESTKVTTVEGHNQRKADAEAAVQRLGTVEVGEVQAPLDISVLKDRSAKLNDMLNDSIDDARALQTRMRGLDRKSTEHETEAKYAQRKLDALKSDECPTCGQDVALVKEEITVSVNTAKALALTESNAVESARSTLQIDIDDIQEELSDLREKAAEARSTVTHADDIAREVKRADNATRQAADELRAAKKVLAEVDAQISELQSDLDSLAADIHARELKIATLKACEMVLGLRGVRAHVLGKALEGIEAVTNRWLIDIAGEGLQLSLKPYTEQGNETVKDAISLDVIGAGGGYGYKASSGGERRRIDVAMVMGLSEVSQAAEGDTGGTLFFDEVFDALDADGQEAICFALADLAADRCVVVISHSPTLAAMLPAVLHLKVSQGTIAAA